MSQPAYQRSTPSVVSVFNIEHPSFCKMAAPSVRDGATSAQYFRLEPNGKNIPIVANLVRKPEECVRRYDNPIYGIQAWFLYFSAWLEHTFGSVWRFFRNFRRGMTVFSFLQTLYRSVTFSHGWAKWSRWASSCSHRIGTKIFFCNTEKYARFHQRYDRSVQQFFSICDWWNRMRYFAFAQFVDFLRRIIPVLIIDSNIH